SLGRRCNYQCSYCDDDAHSNREPFPSREGVFGTADRLHSHFARGARILYAMMGGEPTLIPYYFDLVKHLSEQGHDIATITNGFRDADYLFELSCISHLSISAHFEYIDDERFVAKMAEVVRRAVVGRQQQRIIDVKLMVPPGATERAVRLESLLGPLRAGAP